jgi:glycosyltransferase involved in cell wall biosynthesis
MNDRPAPDRKCLADVTVSVVLPVYNEERVLDALEPWVTQAIRRCGCRPELIFVNDGSRDGSPEALDALARRHEHVRVVHLSRNFGHQAAVQAGLRHASGDVVVVMDSDMQDDADGIARFLEKWREGYDVVYAIRYGRKENALKVLLFHAFYRILNRVSSIPMPADAGNFGLIDRRVADEIARLLDRDRYYAGLRSWVGFRQIGVPVERGPRYDGQPRVSMKGLWRLAKSAVFSFSAVPLTVFYGLGLLAMTVFVSLGLFCLYHKLFTGQAIPGWTSVMMTASFSGALNAMGIAILGEYVMRIYDQVRARPLYVVARRVNFDESAAGEAGSEDLRRAA